MADFERDNNNRDNDIQFLTLSLTEAEQEWLTYVRDLRDETEEFAEVDLGRDEDAYHEWVVALFRSGCIPEWMSRERASELLSLVATRLVDRVRVCGQG